MECEAEWLTADQLEDFYIGVSMVNLCASEVDVTLDGVEVDLYYVETSDTGSEQAVRCGQMCGFGGIGEGGEICGDLWEMRSPVWGGVIGGFGGMAILKELSS